MNDHSIRTLRGDSFKFSVAPLLIKHRTDEHPTCIGSASFISDTGIFLTAKHCFSDFDIDIEGDTFKDVEDNSATVVQILPSQRIVPRKVQFISALSNSDIAVGVAQMWVDTDGNRIPTQAVPLSGRDAKIGDTVKTYAFPNSISDGGDIHVSPKEFQGRVVQHHFEGRDAVMLPNPCYETNMPMPSGTSGGPVFNLLGSVIGVNTSSYDLKDEGAVSFVSKLDGIEHLSVPDGGIEKMITLGDLMKRGKIKIHLWNSAGLEAMSSDCPEKPPNNP